MIIVSEAEHHRGRDERDGPIACRTNPVLEEARVKTPTERGRRKNGHPNKTILADIVRRVVEAAQPDKIILFGSAARSEM